MTRRTKRIAGGLAGLALLAGVAVAAWPASKPYPCRATFEKVKEGMTLAEVERIVGGKAGDYSNEDTLHLWSNLATASSLRQPEYMSWLTNDGDLMIYLDDDSLAERVRIWDTIPAERPSFFNRLRTRLGL